MTVAEVGRSLNVFVASDYLSLKFWLWGQLRFSMAVLLALLLK
jgi:hypothetical protein